MRNIPLTNGVIHMIDDVLYPYEDVPRKLLSMLDLQAFASFVNGDEQLRQQLSDPGTGVPLLRYTVMAPHDIAVTDAMRYRGANNLNLTDRLLVANLTRAHILREELRLGDIKRELAQFVQTNPFAYPQFVRRTTLAGTDLRFYRIWNGLRLCTFICSTLLFISYSLQEHTTFIHQLAVGSFPPWQPLSQAI